METDFRPQEESPSKIQTRVNGVERSREEFCSFAFCFIVIKRMAFFRDDSLSKENRKQNRERRERFPKMYLSLGLAGLASWAAL